MSLKRNIYKYFGLHHINLKDTIFITIILIISVVLYLMPNGFEGAKIKGTKSVKSIVIDVDNSHIHVIGLIKTGEQGLTLKILTGKFKGQTVYAINHFLGKLDLDKFYNIGDRAFTILEIENNKIRYASVIDKYRLNIELILLVIFSLFLLLYAGWTGFKALLSFIFTVLVIWKILLPGYLKYYDPIILSLVIVAVLTAVIIFLVAGFTKKGVVAFLGSMSGVFLTCALSLLFGYFFKIPGEIKPFAETLLYTGFINLKLSKIFLAGIFIASSGAVMDITMDISASMDEILHKHPAIRMRELVLSGFSVGRAVIGTMTTTLLLAYSGGYSTLLMIFIAQGIPLANILNIQYVSAEILHTVIGSFGLVSVAPLTAIIGGVIFHKKINTNI